MTKKTYKTKWRIDLLLEEFYNTQLYLTHDYENSTFDECYAQVTEINKKIAKKNPHTLSKEDLYEFLYLTPEICQSCHYWYRWHLECPEEDVDVHVERMLKVDEMLDTLEPFFESGDFTDCPEMEWSDFMTVFWNGLRFGFTDVVVSQAERLYQFFEATKDIKNIKWVPFVQMNYPMNNFSVNWSRYHLGLCLLLGTAYKENEQPDLAITAYKKAVNANRDPELFKLGVAKIFYHMGINRILEAATELYILEPTEENKKEVKELFLECVSTEIDDTFEALLETLLINYFVYVKVFDGTVD
jgi:tetratricopeptide (TPR) repeat protein